MRWRSPTRTFAVWLITVLALPLPGAAQQGSDGRNDRAAPTAKPDPRRARKAAEKGLAAERAGDWPEALAAYEEASGYAPRDAQILEKREVVRSWLVRVRAESAERYALAGQMEAARNELQAALKVDPGNTVVQERLAQLATMPGPASQEAPPLAGLPRLKPSPGTRSFNLRGDTRSAYEDVAAAFGLTAAFDADLTPRPVRLRLADVNFETVAGLLASQTGTFLRTVNTNTFFVAMNTLEKRREYAPTGQQTFVLSQVTSPEEMTEALRILREMTGAAHISLDADSRTITVRGAPQNLALAGEVIRQIEQARGEMMLEIEILEVDRNEALRLGITPPSTTRLFTVSPNDLTALQQAQNTADLVAILQRIFGSQPGFGGLTASQLASLISAGQLGISALIPPLIAVGGGKTTMLLTLPGAAADFSKALSLVRSGRRMLLRAQDGKTATFFVGDRFPITLSLLSSSLGTGVVLNVPVAGAFPRNDFAVGNGPLALVARDFNGDSLPDLAVANHNDNTITILLNGGDGTFAEAGGSPISLGASETAPAAIASADFNADGLADLVIANQTSNNVTLLLGNGDGAFAPATVSPIAAGSGPSGIVTANFNGDNNRDFAVTNFTDNTVSVFLGDGTGAFTPAAGSPIAPGATGPNALVTADFDGDGNADLAIVNRTSNNVTLLLGNGDGTFTPATASPVSVGQGPVALAAGDIDGDARPDLAVVNQTDNSVSILLNNGDATFSAAVNSPLQFTQSKSPSGVAIADFSVDGRADLTVTNQSDNTVTVFLGLGSGLFAPGFDLSLPASAAPSAIIAADLNNDGRADVAITDQSSNQVSVILNPSSFAPPGTGVGQQPYPGSEYVDLGLKVRATPAMHPNDEVTLRLEFEIRALAGVAVNGIPVLTNRTIDQMVRLKENQTSVIARLLDKEETRAITGLPGFANTPGLGHLAGRRDTQPKETELLILVTPRQLRMPFRKARTFYVGRGDTLVPRGAAVAAPGEPVP